MSSHGDPVPKGAGPHARPDAGSPAGPLTVGGAPPPTAPPPTAPPPTTPPAPVAPARPPSRWGAGRVIAVVVGAVLAFTSLGLLAGGGVLRLADDGIRDSQGYLMSSDVEFASPGYAATSPEVELRNGTPAADLPERWLGTVKVEANARTDNGVFIGIARTSDVEAYLAGVARSTVNEPLGGDRTPDTDFVDGGPPPGAPQDQDFWVRSASGQGQQAITWPAEEGSWTLVVMNGEGSTPVAADVSVGATIPILDDIAVGLLVAGIVLGAIATVLLVAALRRPRSAP